MKRYCVILIFVMDEQDADTITDTNIREQIIRGINHIVLNYFV